jgi:hypothetical protein
VAYSCEDCEVDWEVARETVEEQPAVRLGGVWTDERGGSYALTVVFAAVEGRVQAVAFSVETAGALRGLTQDAVRHIPLARLLSQITRDPPHELIDLVLRPRRVRAYTVSELARVGLDPFRSGRARPRRYDVAFFERVADVYRSSPVKPTHAVAAEFDVPATTAASWVRRARIRGHLEPSPRTHGKNRRVEE